MFQLHRPPDHDATMEVGHIVAAEYYSSCLGQLKPTYFKFMLH
jgi:hypothetical protein